MPGRGRGRRGGATSSIFLGDSPYEIAIHVSRLYLEKDVRRGSHVRPGPLIYADCSIAEACN